ncbi:MAG TPA: hypothetical protein PK295_01860 [Candidatus Magasanikbacteria bacterium]|nr:hypothetical protein [Candidatus Magasanikbacteria bacterium]
MITKKQKLEWVIITLLAVIGIGCLFLVNNSKGMIQIPIFKIIYESALIAIQFAYGFCKMFAILMWYTITHSWITVLITCALIALFITGIAYRRIKD